MQPTTSKLSSIKDTSKCSATPIATSTSSQGYSSTVKSQSVKSHQPHFKKTDSITDILFPETPPRQASKMQSLPHKDEDQQTAPTSPRPRLKVPNLSPLSFNRETSLASTTLAGTSSKRSSPLPGVSPREQIAFSSQHPSTSRDHVLSKGFALDFSLDSKSGNTANREDLLQRKPQVGYRHRLSSLPYRDIFSPIPSEHIDDESNHDYSSAATWGRHGDDGIGKFRNASFPSIKVEDCDESGLEKATSSAGNKDFGSMRKSATISGSSIGDAYNMNKQDAGRRDTASLNVPSPVIKWRTAEGRLIAAMNDNVLTGALSRLCSRSEGNIPFALQDAPGHCHVTDSKVNQTENSSSISRQFSRHVPHYFSSNTPRSSNNSAMINTGRKERFLLTPTLQTEQTSQSNLGFSPGARETDVMKTTPFLSPQPQRRHGPTY